MYFKILGILLASSVLVACGGSPSPSSSSTPLPSSSPSPSPSSTPSSSSTSAPSAATVTIEITKDGFVPNKITINKGDTVAFVNKDTTLHWPASGMHPTHTNYPEGGGCIGSAFDACRGLKTGETYNFTFNQIGTWPYHDHLNASKFGTIEVK